MVGGGGPSPDVSSPRGGPGDPRVPRPGGDPRSRILGGRDRSARNVWIAVASTVIFFGVAAIVIVRSPGWPELKASFFDPAEFRYSLPKILSKFVRNVAIFCIAEVFVLLLALLLAVMRSLVGPVFTPLRILSAAYTDVFRGMPTILVIFLLGYGMPSLNLQGIPDSEFFWAIVALVLVYSAYVAEVYRAGIQAVHPSQVAAARSLGLSRWQSMRHVVLPQAVRSVIPPLLNDFIGLQKDSALVAFLGIIEAFQQATIIQQSDFNFTPFVALALVYIVITIPQARAVDRLIARDQRRRQAAAM
ncbi:MAG TPA: amino acid ABC transporter permease [Actinomycetota bacterium]|nr:amino acid ABC transporter permease [Actinomycetota bacterium]